MQARSANISPAETRGPAEALGPFALFAPPVQAASTLRRAISAAHLRPENECLAPLRDAARCQDPIAALAMARRLTEGLRARKDGGVEALLHEYSLASDEGVALMCLAEALLRIPDTKTRDALIRDKVAGADWRAHLGWDRPVFVNAATWGLVVTGRLMAPLDDRGLASALGQIISRCGEPVIRAGIDLAMRVLGQQFVAGADIETALKRSAGREQHGYRHSYDMLGEAAMTAADAALYFRRYEDAIHAVGLAAGRAGHVRGPGVSVKLSALHPRYSRAQAGRVMAELGPLLKNLAALARSYDIALTIDAEEADRLGLSLDLFEGLRLDPDLAGWGGLGFVVQAYGRRCPYVIDWLVDLARRSHQRIMVRLVKGAYWDTEIKRAQAAGLSSFPVFTRKVYTDISWLACARRLLDAGDLVYPQFATHNARSVADILIMTQGRPHDSWEFQCLHGMGEALYDQLAGEGPACRLYAPVGPQDTLLAYLVRRLLENGANSSFVRLAADPGTSLDTLVADPLATVEAMSDAGAPNPAIRAPVDLFMPQRRNSAGLDLTSEIDLHILAERLPGPAGSQWRSAPVTVATDLRVLPVRPVVNPGDHRDEVGLAIDLAPEAAALVAVTARPWSVDPETRAGCLDHAADRVEAAGVELAGLLMQEAGKTVSAALGEVREATDFLRYYGAQARDLDPHAAPRPGAVLCISPWNFPLAIFIGQIAAALAAGNAVIAKPAEQTPLIAAEAVRILHVAGVPHAALQLAPGDGVLGAALAAQPEISTVLFTGSTNVARKLNRQLAGRRHADGACPLLVAETGGLNCMIVDSSALPEQVVADVMTSAFDSSGQRCSALRVLCLQEDIADHTCRMLRGAMEEINVGRTDRLATDIGPVISAEAKARLEQHVDHLRTLGRKVCRLPLSGDTDTGAYVAPTIIHIESLDDVAEEAFGPVLHILRWRRSGLDDLIAAINVKGYGLTSGLHTRLDGVITRFVSKVRAGNLYVNRNMVGAVVGSQPFGGRGLSGTGPKAGGPSMVAALLGPPLPAGGNVVCSSAQLPAGAGDLPGVSVFVEWLEAQGQAELAVAARRMAQCAPAAGSQTLPGPVGEDNVLTTRPVGTVIVAPATQTGLYSMIAATLATGNRAAVVAGPGVARPLLPSEISNNVAWFAGIPDAPAAGFALLEGASDRLADLRQQLAAGEGAIVPAFSATTEAVVARPDLWPLERLVDEVSLSINTTAAGGNPRLLLL